MEPLVDAAGGVRRRSWWSCRDAWNTVNSTTFYPFFGNQDPAVASLLSCYSHAVRRHPNTLWGDRDVRSALSLHWQHQQSQLQPVEEPPPPYDQPPPPYDQLHDAHPRSSSQWTIDLRPSSSELAEGWFTCYLSSRSILTVSSADCGETERQCMEHGFAMECLHVHRHVNEREEDDIAIGRLPNRDAARLSTADILHALQPVLSAWELEQTLHELTAAHKATWERAVRTLLLLFGMALVLYVSIVLAPLVPGPASVPVVFWLSSSLIGIFCVIAAIEPGCRLCQHYSFLNAIARAQRRLLIEHGILLELHSYLHHNPAVRERRERLCTSNQPILATIAIHYGRLVEDFCMQAKNAQEARTDNGCWRGAATPCCPCAAEVFDPRRGKGLAGEEPICMRWCGN